PIAPSIRSDRCPAGRGIRSRARRASPSSPARSTNTPSRSWPPPNQFKQGHRICVEITSLDVATGVGSATNVEYIPYHICSSKTVLHRIYHAPRHPQHLLLPLIPNAGAASRNIGRPPCPK